MTDIDIFEREMAPYGGRLDWQKVSGTLAGKAYIGIAEHAHDLIASARAHLPTLPSIYFDFVYNGEPNAYAFKREGRYFIGMTTGALVMLQLIFCRILADKQLLQEIGDPNAEAENLPLLTGLVPDAQRMYEAGVIPQRPKTEPRWLYSCRLLTEASLFLIGHEIAHITRGHVDYLDAQTGTPFLAEIAWSQPSQRDLLERQTLEADADHRSVLSRVSSAHETAMLPQTGASPWLSSRPGFEHLLFDLTYAMHSLFRLFGDIRFAGSDLTGAAYPPLPLRRAMTMLVTLHCVEALTDTTTKVTAVNAVRRGALGTELAFMTITGQSVSGAGMQDAFSPDGQKHMKLLAECWNNGLRDRVAPFAYERDPEPPTGPQS